MSVARSLRNAARDVETITNAAATANPRVLGSLLGPAVRGFVLHRGRREGGTNLSARGAATFDWRYEHDRPELARLYAAAKAGQWDPDRDLDWSRDVDILNPEVELFRMEDSPLVELPLFHRCSPARQLEQQAALLAWMLSQFLHGEQGALFVACQVTAAVDGFDGKLYGATQVMDEGRHVEVFERYLTHKLQKRYVINDNLYVILDALMTDSRWDMKFLGMQILVEGLALGAFGTLRQSTHEPLLRELLRLVITDEARHVHFGVLALGDHIRTELGSRERREREDWAFEMCVLLRNRFLAHEFYEEHYGFAMRRSAWDRFLLNSRYMKRFRATLFKRIVPNLKRIHLLPDRLRPRYAELGLLEWEHGKAAPDLDAREMLEG